MSEKDLGDVIGEFFDKLLDEIGAPEVLSRLEEVDRMEDALHQTIDELQPDKINYGVIVVALTNVLADHLVTRATKFPPEVPAPILSMAVVNQQLKVVVAALSNFTQRAIADAETNGATVAYRHRPKPRPEAQEEVPDATGATGPGEDPATRGTDETTFGEAKSGTEG